MIEDEHVELIFASGYYKFNLMLYFVLYIINFKLSLMQA